MTAFRFAVDVMPKEGVLDPQGRAVERSLPQLGVARVHDVRVGRRVELTVDAGDGREARAVVERLSGELFANPLIERWEIEPLDAGAEGTGTGLGPDVEPVESRERVQQEALGHS